jgi:uncharacterized membrane protein YfcA
MGGGWAGAHLAQRLPAQVLRAAVVAFALGVAGWLFWKG